jgi:hypothetical protein
MPYLTQTAGIAVGDNDQFFRIRDIDPLIKELNTDDGIFYKVLSMLPSEAPANQPKYEWAEDDIPAVTTQVNLAAGYSAVATAIVVDDALGMIANSLVYVAETREIMYVTAVVNATNTLTVVRGFAGSTPAAIADNDTIMFMGDQLPERAVANTNNGSIPTAFFNYIQRWSKGVTISDMQDNVMMLDGVGQMPREVLRKALEMKRQINNALIRGRKGAIVSPVSADDGFVYTSHGFEGYITTNELDLGNDNGNLSWEALNNFSNPLFTATSSSPTKMVLCGEALFSLFTKIAWDRFAPASFESTLGATLQRVVTDQGGVLDVVLDKYGFPAGTPLSGEGIIVDLAHVALKEFVGQPLTWRPNVQANNAHVRQDELWGTASLKLSHESTMGKIKGAVVEYL